MLRTILGPRDFFRWPLGWIIFSNESWWKVIGLVRGDIVTIVGVVKGWAHVPCRHSCPFHCVRVSMNWLVPRRTMKYVGWVEVLSRVYLWADLSCSALFTFQFIQVLSCFHCQIPDLPISRWIHPNLFFHCQAIILLAHVFPNRRRNIFIFSHDTVIINSL